MKGKETQTRADRKTAPYHNSKEGRCEKKKGSVTKNRKQRRKTSGRLKKNMVVGGKE